MASLQTYSSPSFRTQICMHFAVALRCHCLFLCTLPLPYDITVLRHRDARTRACMSPVNHQDSSQIHQPFTLTSTVDPFGTPFRPIPHLSSPLYLCAPATLKQNHTRLKPPHSTQIPETQQIPLNPAVSSKEQIRLFRLPLHLVQSLREP